MKETSSANIVGFSKEMFEVENNTINVSDIHEEIELFLSRDDSLYSDYIITPRIVKRFTSAIVDMIREGKLDDTVDSIKKTLSAEISVAFVQSRQPYLEPVSDEVVEDLKKYFKDNLSSFDPVSVMRKSNMMDDSYLYCVIAKKSEGMNVGTYSCWTGWNESTQSLNYGHYGLPDYESAFAVILENFNDITDDIVRFGPGKTLVEFPAYDERLTYWDEELGSYMLSSYGELVRPDLNIDEINELGIKEDSKHKNDVVQASAPVQGNNESTVVGTPEESNIVVFRRGGR